MVLSCSLPSFTGPAEAQSFGEAHSPFAALFNRRGSGCYAETLFNTRGSGCYAETLFNTRGSGCYAETLFNTRGSGWLKFSDGSEAFNFCDVTLVHEDGRCCGWEVPGFLPGTGRILHQVHLQSLFGTGCLHFWQ